jgi:hypothetical protein
MGTGWLANPWPPRQQIEFPSIERMLMEVSGQGESSADNARGLYWGWVGWVCFPKPARLRIW